MGGAVDLPTQEAVSDALNNKTLTDTYRVSVCLEDIDSECLLFLELIKTKSELIAVVV
jgi:hypothetical protein